MSCILSIFCVLGCCEGRSSVSVELMLHVTCLKGNVAVYKGLLLELPSGHVIIITVYTFPSVY